jgi:uncharacterized membrane protein
MGFSMSLLGYLLSFLYLIQLWFNMESQVNDQYKSLTVINELSEKSGTLYWKDFNYLPTISVFGMRTDSLERLEKANIKVF